jgi:hypothetical protein
MPKPEREVAFMKIVITRDVYRKMEEFRQVWADAPEVSKVDEVVVVVQLDGHDHEVKMTLQQFLDRLGLYDAAKRLLVRVDEAA